MLLVMSVAAPLAAVAQTPDFAVEGKRLFMTGAVPACAVCHTLAKAGATGQIGPVLDELQPDAGRVERAVRQGINQMPSYSATLSDAQIKTLARYVEWATKPGSK